MLMHLNQIVEGDCVELMKQLPDGLIPLTVTSPPFDRLRTYDGWLGHFDFEATAIELFRITSPGGIVCWHVQEQIADGCESGTASEQRLYFRSVGFCLYGTLILDTGFYVGDRRYRYGKAPHYVFLLSKGRRRAFHPIADVPNKLAGEPCKFRRRDKDGRNYGPYKCGRIQDVRQRSHIWRYATGSHNSEGGTEHPAIMHIDLARDLIHSFFEPADLVFDPFCGEGTTPVAAKRLQRHYLGFEISPYWVNRANERLRRTQL